jgi:hypothetical protein
MNRAEAMFPKGKTYLQQFINFIFEFYNSKI